METVTIIRVVSGVLFVVVLFILIQRRKGRTTRAFASEMVAISSATNKYDF